MSDIDALRERVEAAERSFGLIDERERTYSTRLIKLIGSIEEQLRHHQTEIAEREAREKALDHENRELRAMLHSLLKAVEDGGGNQLGDAINDMDHRIAALLATQSAQSPSSDGQAVASEEPLEDDSEETGAIAPTEPIGEEAQVADDGAAEEEQSPPADLALEGAEDSDLEADGSSDEAAQPTVPEEVAAEEVAVEEIAVEEIAVEEIAVEEPVSEEVAPEPVDTSLDDQLIDAVAEAIEQEPTPVQEEVLDLGALEDIEVETEDQDELLADLSMADLESADDDVAAAAPEVALNPPAPQTHDSTEGTDVVMTEGEQPGQADPPPEAGLSDPELAERAEKIAQLLGSGDESDPTVKEIIEKVTELAETIAPMAKASEPEDVDLTVEMEDEPVGESTPDPKDGELDPLEAEALAEVTAA